MYEIRLQSDPEKTIEKLAKKARSRFLTINEALEQLSRDPYMNTEALQDPLLKGFRRVRAKSDRIVFQLCEECRRDSYLMEKRQCIDCSTFPDNTIMVFDIDTRSKVMYEKKHKRR